MLLYQLIIVCTDLVCIYRRSCILEGEMWIDLELISMDLLSVLASVVFELVGFVGGCSPQAPTA